MEQEVDIPVTIRGEERTFTGRVQAWQYGLRFVVDVDGADVVFERDDAGEFRAIVAEEHTGKPPEKEVIGAIVAVLEAL